MGGKWKPRQTAHGEHPKAHRVAAAANGGPPSPLTRIYIPKSVRERRMKGRYGYLPCDGADADSDED